MATGRLPITAPLVALFLIAGCQAPVASQDRGDPVKAAIKQGADFLQNSFLNDQSFAALDRPVGSSSLAGIAMLESGVPKNSRAISAITAYLRSHALEQTQTYEVALTAMYLDRLGDPADRPTIQFLGIRLLAGQGITGGWGYSCGEPLPAAELTRMSTLFAGGTQELVIPEGPEPPKPAPPVKKANPNVPQPVAKPKEAPKAERADPDAAESQIHPYLNRYLRLVSRIGREDVGDGDNSNGQFAIVGLWCARRAGLNVDTALRRTEARFRRSQTGEGGWGYTPGDGSSTATMTCSGLMGLALGAGISASNGGATLRTPATPVPVGKEAPANGGQDIRDRQILRGLARVEAYIAQSPPGSANALGENYYFLWSVERVGMALGTDNFGRLDWYRWGCDCIVKQQNPGGSWNGNGGHGIKDPIDTAFALLFLNRTNMTKELTKSLKSKPSLDLGSGKEPKTNGPAVTRTNVPVPVTPAEPKVVKMAPTTGGTAATEVEDDTSRQAGLLCQKLLRASANDRKAILVELRDSKGAVYTEALIRAAAQGPQSMLADIREALADRLKRMTRSTLRDMMKDGNAEIRRGAATAAGRKGDAELIAPLIDVLADAENGVVQAARQALKTLSGGQDFGPEDGAVAADRLRAMTAWKAWKN